MSIIEKKKLLIRYAICFTMIDHFVFIEPQYLPIITFYAFYYYYYLILFHENSEFIIYIQFRIFPFHFEGKKSLTVQYYDESGNGHK